MKTRRTAIVSPACSHNKSYRALMQREQQAQFFLTELADVIRLRRFSHFGATVFSHGIATTRLAWSSMQFSVRDQRAAAPPALRSRPRAGRSRRRASARSRCPDRSSPELWCGVNWRREIAGMIEDRHSRPRGCCRAGSGSGNETSSQVGATERAAALRFVGT